ncbi:MAG: GNAT family N-acetyltransferase [Anaerolineales bacterium]|nr:GNAT family N-acetyltransferase [Anaerolineales bacterium]
MSRNLCAWMESSLAGFGVAAHRAPGLWWRDPGGSEIYLGAVITDRDTTVEELARELQTVQTGWHGDEFYLYDCWGTRDLTNLGFERVVKNPWYLRLPGVVAPLRLPDSITLERAVSAAGLAEFEAASWMGFGDSDEPLAGRAAFSMHPISTLDYANMHYLIVRCNGEVAAGVIAQVTEEMVGIYGLSTVPRYRRRGYARALVHACVALRPDLSTSVFPDPPTVPIYTDLSFFIGGEIALWRSTSE